MRKILTFVGTRPELIKLSLVIREMDRAFEHVLVHTGQNYDYELNEIFFKDLGVRKPDFFLNCAQGTAMETIARILVEGDKILLQEKPDALLIYGDTNSCLVALAAKKRRIPIFHMEAGNRCFDQRVPEEINRKVIDHLSDINMPLTEHGREFLLAEGLSPSRIIKTGSCMKEILAFFGPQIDSSKILNQLQLDKQKYFVVSSHREENVDDPQKLHSLIESLKALYQEYKVPIVFSIHPRTLKKLEQLKNFTMPKEIIVSKPLGFFDYVHLQLNSLCVLSDSGTLMEETAILGFPAVMLRDAHERMEGMDSGTLIVSSIDVNRITEAVAITLSQAARYEHRQHLVPDYQIDGVSQTVIRIIQSYIDLINREVWKK